MNTMHQTKHRWVPSKKVSSVRKGGPRQLPSYVPAKRKITRK